MEEFIKKLIGRLEEEYNYQKTKAFQAGIDVGCGEEPKMITEERCRYKNAQCFDASIQIVEELAKEYNGGWITCENELPKETGYYLVSSKAMVWVAHWFNNTWWGIEKISRWGNIIAWQNLPAPYNPKGE